MLTTVREKDDVRFVECAGQLERAGDANDLISACVENQAPRLLLHAQWLPPAFFDLRSGMAGEVIQKLANYRIRTAAVIPPDPAHSDRFREFLLEARKGSSFRVFDAEEEAVLWLAGA